VVTARSRFLQIDEELSARADQCSRSAPSGASHQRDGFVTVNTCKIGSLCEMGLCRTRHLTTSSGWGPLFGMCHCGSTTLHVTGRGEEASCERHACGALDGRRYCQEVVINSCRSSGKSAAVKFSEAKPDKSMHKRFRPVSASRQSNPEDGETGGMDRQLQGSHMEDVKSEPHGTITTTSHASQYHQYCSRKPSSSFSWSVQSLLVPLYQSAGTLTILAFAQRHLLLQSCYSEL